MFGSTICDKQPNIEQPVEVNEVKDRDRERKEIDK